VDVSSADKALVQRIRDNDRDAFDALVVHYAADLVQLGTIMLRDRDLAEDVAQDVFVRVWANRSRWMLRGSLRAYLMRAVANQVRNLRSIESNRRRLETQEHDILVPSNVSFETLSESARADAQLWAAVQRLPDRWREGVLLRYEQQVSFAEVGEIMHISEGAAQKLVQRAIAALRETLAD
jgi:RNA polymerase sigma-70 factor (ECF subfamily)